MANIFAGTELPAWLQERNRVNAEHGQWGQLAGTLAGGLLNAFKPDQSAPTDPETGKKPAQGFGQGLFEARMNQQDPMWKLKTAQIQQSITSQAVQAEGAHALAQERIRENKGIMHDLPYASKWAAIPASKWNLDDIPLPPDGLQSTWAPEFLEKTSNQKANQLVANERTKTAQEKVATGTEYATARLGVDDETGIALDDLRSKGQEFEITPDGRITNYPSAAALSIIRKAQLAKGELPVGASEAMRKDYSQKEREKSRVDLQEKKGTQALEQIEARGKANIAAVDKRIKGMQDLEKLRFADRTERDKAIQAFYKEPPKIYPGPTPNSFIMVHGRSTQVINPRTNKDMSLKGEMDAATAAMKNAWTYKQAALQSGDKKQIAKADEIFKQASDAMFDLEKRAATISRPATGDELNLLPGEEPHDDNSAANPSRFKVLEVK